MNKLQLIKINLGRTILLQHQFNKSPTRNPKKILKANIIICDVV